MVASTGFGEAGTVHNGGNRRISNMFSWLPVVDETAE